MCWPLTRLWILRVDVRVLSSCCTTRGRVFRLWKGGRACVESEIRLPRGHANRAIVFKKCSATSTHISCIIRSL